MGSVYVNNRKFVIDKHPTSLSNILEKGHDFLGHMPYNGWTLAHLRAASHGSNAHRNTHPFIIGNSALIHNGVWREYSIAKRLLEKEVSFKGETDTEVAGHFLRKIGPQKFLQEIDFGGVFMSLKRNGKLEIVKTSGDLTIFRRADGSYLIASTLDSLKYKNQKEWGEGWYRFNKNGKLAGFSPRKEEVYDDDEDDEDDYEEITKSSSIDNCMRGSCHKTEFAGEWEFINNRWVKNYTSPAYKSKLPQQTLMERANKVEEGFHFSCD